MVLVSQCAWPLAVQAFSLQVVPQCDDLVYAEAAQVQLCRGVPVAVRRDTFSVSGPAGFGGVLLAENGSADSGTDTF